MMYGWVTRAEQNHRVNMFHWAQKKDQHKKSIGISGTNATIDNDRKLLFEIELIFVQKF